MKTDITYHELLQIDADITAQSANSICFRIFMRDKTDSFYRHNHNILWMARQKVIALMKEHIVLDEKGECKSIIKADGTREYIWNTVSSKAAYDAACKEFLNRTTTIII